MYVTTLSKTHIRLRHILCAQRKKKKWSILESSALNRLSPVPQLINEQKVVILLQTVFSGSLVYNLLKKRRKNSIAVGCISDIRGVKHDLYSKRQWKWNFCRLSSAVCSRVILFVFAMNSRRGCSTFVCFIYEKNSNSKVIFAVCRLPLTSQHKVTSTLARF